MRTVIKKYILLLYMRKSYTFHDFQKLNLGGKLVLLTFGQYCHKNFGCSNPAKRRKVIKYYYDHLKSK